MLPVTWRQLERYLYVIKRLKKTPDYLSRFKIIDSYFINRKLTRDTAADFLYEMQNVRKYKNNTLNNLVKLLRNIEKCSNIDSLELSYFTKDRTFKETLTPLQINKLAEVRMPYVKEKMHSNSRYRAVIYILAIGVRPNELRQLVWEDIKEDRIIIRSDVSKTKVLRFIPIRGTGVYELVMKLKRSSSPYVFGWGQGKICEETINKEIQRRARAIGIEKHVTAYTLRYSFVTNSILEGKSIALIQRIVGHQSLDTTAGYAQLVLKDIEPVVSEYRIFKQPLTVTQLNQKLCEYAQKLIEGQKYTLENKFTSTHLNINIKRL